MSEAIYRHRKEALHKIRKDTLAASSSIFQEEKLNSFVNGRACTFQTVASDKYVLKKTKQKKKTTLFSLFEFKLLKLCETNI